MTLLKLNKHRNENKMGFNGFCISVLIPQVLDKQGNTFGSSFLLTSLMDVLILKTITKKLLGVLILNGHLLDHSTIKCRQAIKFQIKTMKVSVNIRNQCLPF